MRARGLLAIAIVLVLARVIVARAAPGNALDETLEEDEAADESADGLELDDRSPVPPPSAAGVVGAPPIAAGYTQRKPWAESLRSPRRSAERVW